MSKQNWRLAIKNRKQDGLYNISVRYYEAGVEKYMDTEYRVSREDWEATSGKAFKRVKEIRDVLKTKIQATCNAIDEANQTITFDLFKAVWNGKRLSLERSWISLLDKHLELNDKRYTHGTKRVYATTRDILVKIDKAGYDLSLGNFQTVADYERLEGWFQTCTGIGKTALSINMQNIKVIANTGYSSSIGLKWIKTDAFKEYKKPKRKVGTHPNTVSDFKRIRDVDVSTITVNSYHQRGLQFARDFWCFMVLNGGMEIRSVAGLLWENVHNNYFSFTRAKTKDSGAPDISHPTDTEFNKYIFEKYAVRGGKYVFPFWTEDMTEAQRETAIANLGNKITRRVQTIAKHLGIKPLPSCKRTRPTFAVISRELGLDIYKQKVMMGHKKISTTEIYMAHLPTKDKLDYSKDFHDSLE